MIAENKQIHQHSEESVHKIIYAGNEFNEYCCASGISIFNGQSKKGINLGREVTHLARCIENDGSITLAAGQGKCGNIKMIDYRTMTPLFNITSEHLSSFEDFKFLQTSNVKDEENYQGYESDQKSKSNRSDLVVLSKDNIVKFNLDWH